MSSQKEKYQWQINILNVLDIINPLINENSNYIGIQKCHSLKKMKINAEKVVGKEKITYIVGKITNCTVTMETNVEISYHANTILTI